MKNVKFTFAIIIMTLMGVSMALSSCGNSAKKATDKQGKEYTSAYVCPMHCEGSGSDQPGKCPSCGMDYVKNDNQSYVCPMHPEVTGAKGDKCPKCGMKLTENKVDDHEGHDH